MKVITSLLVVAFVAVAVSALITPEEEADLKNRIAQVNIATEALTKQIAVLSERRDEATNPLEKNALGKAVNNLKNGINLLKERKQWLEARLAEA